MGRSAHVNSPGAKTAIPTDQDDASALPSRYMAEAVGLIWAHAWVLATPGAEHTATRSKPSCVARGMLSVTTPIPHAGRVLVASPMSLPRKGRCSLPYMSILKANRNHLKSRFGASCRQVQAGSSCPPSLPPSVHGRSDHDPHASH